MHYPDDFSRHTPMSEPEMILAIRRAVRLRLRYLRWARWRKNMTAEDVLKHHGVDAFAQEVAEHLVQSNSVLFQGPPCPDAGIGNR